MHLLFLLSIDAPASSGFAAGACAPSVARADIYVYVYVYIYVFINFMYIHKCIHLLFLFY